jgi:hypothetical protein
MINSILKFHVEKKQKLINTSRTKS